MERNLTVWGAAGLFFRTLWDRFRTKKWWKTVLWILWVVGTLSFLSAIFESFGEYEPRAAWFYGVLFLILLIIGVWAALHGSPSLQAKEKQVG